MGRSKALSGASSSKRHKHQEYEEEEEEEVEEEGQMEVEDNNDYDDDSDIEMKVIRNSTAGKLFAEMPKSERDRKVSDVIRCVLALDTKGLPIRRDTIKQQCFSSERDKQYSRAIVAVIAHANKKLNEVFGMKLVDIPIGKDLEAIAASQMNGDEAVGRQETSIKTTQVWVLMNTLSQEQKGVSVSLSKKENSEMGLLVFVLAMIHMKDNSLLDVSLWRYLKPLGIYETKKHPVFGDTGKLLKDLTKERFLQRIKLTRNDGTTCYEYKWGSRAYKEMNATDVLEFVVEILGDDAQIELVNKLERMKRSRMNRHLEEHNLPEDISA